MYRYLYWVAFVLLTGCSTQVAPVIDESLLPVYSPQLHTNTYARWGEEGVQRISRAQRQALYAIARQPACDQVTFLALTETMSQPPATIVTFVQCRNLWRFYIDQDARVLSSEHRG
ncbi:hypothetical protein [Pseudomonas sp. 2835]|uniref:hypothetical protein n=1 Tax=Pseudomonas sp. 2835 TaxID=3156451 RepID=UPI003D263B5A